MAIVEPVAESKAAPEPAPEHEAWSEPEPPAKPARPEFADPLAHALADLAIAQAELARVQSRNVEVERALEIAPVSYTHLDVYKRQGYGQYRWVECHGDWERHLSRVGVQLHNVACRDA